jgi:hypothetical protein
MVSGTRAAALAVLLAAACAPASTPTATPTPSPTPTAATTACPSATGGEATFVHLTDVRVGTHAGFDRVTFEFVPSSDAPPAIPTYQLDAASPPFVEDGSGNPIELEGSHFARLIFHGASGAKLSGETVMLTYQGPKEIKPGFTVLTEVQETGDFEATLSWALGLSRSSCWKVVELSDPLRVVIDLPH